MKLEHYMASNITTLKECIDAYGSQVSLGLVLTLDIISLHHLAYEKGIGVSDLSNLTDLPISVTSRHCQKLREMGLIRETRHHTDSRRNQIEPSAQAMENFENRSQRSYFYGDERGNKKRVESHVGSSSNTGSYFRIRS